MKRGCARGRRVDRKWWTGDATRVSRERGSAARGDAARGETRGARVGAIGRVRVS